MASKLYIAKVGGGTIDLTGFTNRKGAPFFEDGRSLIQLGMRCANGQASQGTFTLVDPEAEVPRTDFEFNLPAHKLVTWTEDAPGAEIWLSRGRTSTYEGGRGPVIADNEVEYPVTVDDGNMELGGQDFTEPWVRPAETDVARIIALESYTLNGASSTATHHRDTCAITVSESHLVTQPSPFTMPAKTYPVGTTPQSVIEDCATTAGMFFSVVIHHTGGSHLCLLYILDTDHSTYPSGIKISDHLDEWLPWDPTTPVYEPHWEAGKATLYDGQRLLSGMNSIYNSANSVFVEIPGNITAYDYWVESYYDSESVTLAQAEARANSLLLDRSLTKVTHRVSIIMLPEQLDLVAAGMSLEIKAAAAIGGQYLDTWQTRRVVECQFEPRPDGRYWAHLNLDRITGRQGVGSGQPAATTPKPPPVCDPGGTAYEPDLSTDTCWPGYWATSDGDPLLQAFLPARWKTGSGGTSFDCSHNFLDGVLTPGASYRLEITFANKYFAAGPYNYIFRWRDMPGEVETGSFTLVVANIPGGFAPTTYGVDFVVPAGGYDHVHGSFPTFGPGLYKNVNITTEGESDPFCQDPDQSGDPDDPYYAPSTHLHDDKYAALVHQHPQLTERLLNNSGGAVSKGDIVIADQSLDGAFTTTTTASFTDGPVWVVEDETIADDASGLVLISGLATFVNLGGAAPTRGDFLFTATTAKRASTAGARAAGAFGQVLVNEADADGEPGAVIWGVPDMGSGSGAPSTVNYLVGTADAGLSAEIVVGTSPGGELGGTWASPTVDATHSGSPHHAEDHAAEHADGGGDELEVEDLATAETDTSKILAADGAGGLTFVGIGDVPSGDLVQIGSGEGSVRIPGLEAHFGKVGLGGGGIEEEYNTATTGLTWTPSDPATVDSDTSVGSHLYVVNSDTTERLGLRTFAPAGDFDVRMHLSTGRDSGASNADMGVIVTSTGNLVRAMTQIQIPSGAAGQANIQAWTYAAVSYTQRGSTIVGAGWGGAVVLRLQYVSGSIYFSFSHDGHTWYRIASLAFAITVANIGVRVSCGASTVIAGISDFLRTDV